MTQDFIRESMEDPTILFENTSLIAHAHKFPSLVQCSVMVASHNSFGDWP